MPKIHVSACPAGPALDAAVAKVLMELHGVTLPDGALSIRAEGPVAYSLDIAAAWGLIEEMGVRHSPSVYQIARWYCNFLVDGKRIEAIAGTATLAIVRAYLLAHGVFEVEVPEEVAVNGGEYGH